MCVVGRDITIIVHKSHYFHIPKGPHGNVVDLVGEPSVNMPRRVPGQSGPAGVEDEAGRWQYPRRSLGPIYVDLILIGSKVQIITLRECC